jgi:hypothetical protein
MRTISPTLANFLNNNPGAVGSIVLPSARVPERSKSFAQTVLEHGVYIFMPQKEQRHDN